MTDETGRELVSQADTPQQLEMWGEMLAVERERIASRDRAVDVMREGFSKLDAADERQYKFQSDRLKRDDEYRNRHLTHRIRLTWVIAGSAVLVVGVILFMAFWGGDSQQNLAGELTRDAIAAGAFIGLGFLLGRRSRG